ncbi:MAG TPA: ribose 5-phosphate isomerase B, partial [candidate division Zixibacteria bacterium]|nr:ribose 5-phosphate isomerase B [candidate division Zixibacteria bacterium]
GSDHAGFDLKEKVKVILQNRNIEVIDFGTESKDSVDYPDYGLRVAQAVVTGQADKGVAICWTGGGMTIATNKIRGVRATLCLDKDMAFYARSHNDINVLVLSQKYVKDENVNDIIDTWLSTEFEGGRHTRRLEKIKNAEKT